ncbi:protein of unknown function [Methylocaldum szegediense]|uniref:Uncharacterized protein n=1 Tax=Methylocaldum szegediense TaxID=73780 RepID=A0ABN8X739_9GAMM|nr:protein of unknown function [Methylocaldum szegediense]
MASDPRCEVKYYGNNSLLKLLCFEVISGIEPCFLFNSQ